MLQVVFLESEIPVCWYYRKKRKSFVTRKTNIHAKLYIQYVRLTQIFWSKKKMLILLTFT